MFEEMLKELLLKLIREDTDVQSAMLVWASNSYAASVTTAVKCVIESDEMVQDVIRKQATTDIFEAIADDVEEAIERVVDGLTFDINVSRS